jgi:hypothetical protein
MFHSRPLGRRNKRILNNKRIVTTVMIMKMKRSNQPQFSSLENNWRFYLK